MLLTGTKEEANNELDEEECIEENLREEVHIGVLRCSSLALRSQEAKIATSVMSNVVKTSERATTSAKALLSHQASQLDLSRSVLDPF